MVASLPTPADPRDHGAARRRGPSTPRRSRARLLIGGVLAAALAATGLVAAGGTASAATQICEKYGSTTVSGGKYIVQNNVWGTSQQQCITVTDNGFQITTANHNVSTSGAPASYPSIYAGCHYANCSTGSGLPMAVNSSSFNQVTTGVSMTYPSSGEWDASYDIWFDPTPRKDGQNTGAELMVWLNHAGRPQPIGSKVATVNLAGGTWDVWYGNSSWKVVSYVRTTPTSSINFAVRDFFDDMVARGYGQRSWYLTSVQAGFEPWIGGQGLAVNSFSYSTSGSVPTTPVPTTSVPTTPVPTTSGPGTPNPGNGACSAAYSTVNSWSGGFTGEITVKASQSLSGWKVSWPLASGQSISNVWGGRSSVSGGTATVTNEAWNGALTAGGSTTVGFTASGAPSTPTVTCTAS